MLQRRCELVEMTAAVDLPLCNRMTHVDLIVILEIGQRDPAQTDLR